MNHTFTMEFDIGGVAVELPVSCDYDYVYEPAVWAGRMEDSTPEYERFDLYRVQVDGIDGLEWLIDAELLQSGIEYPSILFLQDQCMCGESI